MSGAPLLLTHPETLHLGSGIEEVDVLLGEGILPPEILLRVAPVLPALGRLAVEQQEVVRVEAAVAAVLDQDRDFAAGDTWDYGALETQNPAPSVQHAQAFRGNRLQIDARFGQVGPGDFVHAVAADREPEHLAAQRLLIGCLAGPGAPRRETPGPRLLVVDEGVAVQQLPPLVGPGTPFRSRGAGKAQLDLDAVENGEFLAVEPGSEPDGNYFLPSQKAAFPERDRALDQTREVLHRPGRVDSCGDAGFDDLHLDFAVRGNADGAAAVEVAEVIEGDRLDRSGTGWSLGPGLVEKAHAAGTVPGHFGRRRPGTGQDGSGMGKLPGESGGGFRPAGRG